MQTHPQLAELITEDDEEALKHLTDIRFRDLEDNPGFKLEFYFEPNDFFSDSVLTKTYYLANEGALGVCLGFPVIDRSTLACNIPQTMKSSTITLKEPRFSGKRRRT